MEPTKIIIGSALTEPIKIINYDLELVSILKSARNKAIINDGQLRLALERGEITLREFVEIIN